MEYDVLFLVLEVVKVSDFFLFDVIFEKEMLVFFFLWLDFVCVFVVDLFFD